MAHSQLCSQESSIPPFCRLLLAVPINGTTRHRAAQNCVYPGHVHARQLSFTVASPGHRPRLTCRLQAVGASTRTDNTNITDAQDAVRWHRQYIFCFIAHSDCAPTPSGASTAGMASPAPRSAVVDGSAMALATPMNLQQRGAGSNFN